MERDLSQEAAERLLSGDLTAPPEGTERLAALLAAASAPGRPDELAGEASAMAAFRAQPPAVRRRSLKRALTAKVAAAIIAATVAAGGVAVASGTGLLPVPFLPAKPGPAPSGTDGPAGRSPTRGHTASPAASPLSETLVTLCTDYQKKTAEEKRKELKGKRFEELVRAAGGAERVDDFCVRAIGAPPTPGKSKDGGPNPGGPHPGTPNPGSGNQQTAPQTPAPNPNASHGRSIPSR